MRAAHGMMSADLDALEEVFAGYEGPLKISLCGPWTLAATIELARTLNPVLADPAPSPTSPVPWPRRGGARG